MKVSVSSTNSSLLVNLSVELLKDNLGNGQRRPSEFFGSLVFPEKCSRFLSDATIPHICHCKFFLAGVNFYRFNAKNWQFTVCFAVITQKIGNLLCILS